jgi:hypothetical protein
MRYRSAQLTTPMQKLHTLRNKTKKQKENNKKRRAPTSMMSWGSEMCSEYFFSLAVEVEPVSLRVKGEGVVFSCYLLVT